MAATFPGFPGARRRRLFWRDANWLARINYLHAFAQNIAASVKPRPRAIIPEGEISYKTKLDASWFGARE
jgi:iron complex outermembrane receptor protein